MNYSKNYKRPTRRLKVGESVLDAAKVTDTAPVADLLDAFVEAHAAYKQEQDTVDEADARRRLLTREVAKVEKELDEAIGELDYALMVDRLPRPNPFSAFGAPSPSAIRDLPAEQKARVVLALVADVHGHGGLSTESLAVAAKAEQAANAVLSAVEPLGKAQATLRTNRNRRNRVGRTWDVALRNLRSTARVMASVHDTDLYADLFADAPTTSGSASTGKSSSGVAEAVSAEAVTTESEVAPASPVTTADEAAAPEEKAGAAESGGAASDDDRAEAA